MLWFWALVVDEVDLHGAADRLRRSWAFVFALSDVVRVRAWMQERGEATTQPAWEPASLRGADPRPPLTNLSEHLIHTLVGIPNCN